MSTKLEMRIEELENELALKSGKSQTVKEYVKEVTDHMKDDTECNTVQVDNFVFSAKGIEILPKNTTSDNKHGGLRYNQGKLRYDLICPEQLKGLASVYTYGANKYAPQNWRKGQAWSTVLASLKRHIASFERGEDFDPESQCLHMSHAMWNCGELISFGKFYPQGDDRLASWQRIPRISLDVDEIICAWVQAYCKRYDMDIPHCWNFDPKMSERMAELKNDMDFWAGIEPLIKAEDLPFEPAAYITSRPIPNEWTQEWLWHHKFPVAPVITVEHGADKLLKCEELGINWHVDDNFDTFRHLNANGMHCFLMDAKHNQRYDVGSKRIKSLVELKERW